MAWISLAYIWHHLLTISRCSFLFIFTGPSTPIRHVFSVQLIWIWIELGFNHVLCLYLQLIAHKSLHTQFTFMMTHFSSSMWSILTAPASQRRNWSHNWQPCTRSRMRTLSSSTVSTLLLAVVRALDSPLSTTLLKMPSMLNPNTAWSALVCDKRFRALVNCARTWRTRKIRFVVPRRPKSDKVCMLVVKSDIWDGAYGACFVVLFFFLLIFFSSFRTAGKQPSS